MLLKHVYRVGRAVKHQSNMDMENYKNRPLNKHISITAISYIIMRQHTCQTEVNPELTCTKDKGHAILCKAEYFCTAAY